MNKKYMSLNQYYDLDLYEKEFLDEILKEICHDDCQVEQVVVYEDYDFVDCFVCKKNDQTSYRIDVEGFIYQYESLEDFEEVWMYDRVVENETVTIL